MSLNRLLTAAAAVALAGGLGLAQSATAQTPATAKTEAAAKAATGKSSSDAPANSQQQGTAKAVKEGAPAAATAGASTQAPAATTSMAAQVSPSGDLVDTLRASGQFNSFIKAIDSTNLTGLLKTNKNLTVFAPTDGAFAAMPQAQRDQLLADKAALQKFVLHHVINAPVDSTKIKGAKGPVPSGAGDSLLLDGSDETGALKADGATIVQSDIRTGSGLLHVVDRVLVAGQGGAMAATGEAAASSTAAPAQPQGTNSKAQ